MRRFGQLPSKSGQLISAIGLFVAPNQVNLGLTSQVIPHRGVGL